MQRLMFGKTANLYVALVTLGSLAAPACTTVNTGTLEAGDSSSDGTTGTDSDVGTGSAGDANAEGTTEVDGESGTDAGASTTSDTTTGGGTATDETTGTGAETCAADSCGPNALCDDSTGFVECTCDGGFEGDGLTCTDIDECAEGTDDCDALCVNGDGGFVCAIPQTCADIVAAIPEAIDAEFELYYEANPNQSWTAYCHDMAGTPRAFLPLPQAGPDTNFGQYTAGGPSTGADVRTNFQRIAIDPVSLEIDIDDRTFATSTGSLMHSGSEVTEMPYAVAMACFSTVATGLANIDLTGTPFVIASAFCQAGSNPNGSAVIDASGRVADLTGGGFCGWTSPSNPCASSPQDGTSGTVLALGYSP